MPLTDRVALVLGGTGGLGSSIVQRLENDGCKLDATYYSESSLQRAKSLSSHMKIIRTDVTDEGQVHLLFDTVISESQNVDIVVNTVGGYLSRKPLTEVTMDEWDRMMNINLRAAFLSSREALRRMRG
jgi:NAD(P)-dependent dehydrogenase (short-subunit alcohol dehydrogenase family)